MTAPAGGPGAQSWPLRGTWRTWLWVSAFLAALFLLGGVAIVATVGPLAVVPATVLVLVGGMIGWQVLHTATEVTLGADGTLTLKRLLGPVRTTAAGVRARPSKLKSRHTPTVVETAEGWAYLVHPQAERKAVIAALARHNPGVAGGR